jgi:integrase
MFRVLAAYYAENSPLLAEAVQRGRKILDATRAVYRNFIVNSFIPFLRRRKTKTFADITPPLIADFQTALLAKGLKPRTVNWNLAGLSSAFAHLVMKGILPVNAFDAVKRLPVNDDARRGCYEIDKLNGAFNAAWDDERSYLLNMLVYATGMRNGEIERIRLRDVVEHDGARFIDVKKSKTKYGIRLAPLHEKVYTALIKYAAGKSPDDFVFSKNGGKLCRAVYRQAYATLGQRLGVTADYLAAQDISFYGGRHFWKTLMSAEGLGANAEEYFMGHGGAGVAERYNHRDKIGLSRFAARAREAFAILDRTVFRSAD